MKSRIQKSENVNLNKTVQHELKISRIILSYKPNNASYNIDNIDTMDPIPSEVFDDIFNVTFHRNH